jgi:hypothetical protein
MRTKRRSPEQLNKTSASRADLFKFMERFSGKNYWTIDGPMDTEVDEIFCFALWGKDGSPMGVCLVQTWLSGGWSIFVEPSKSGALDATEEGMRSLHDSSPIELPPVLMTSSLP